MSLELINPRLAVLSAAIAASAPTLLEVNIPFFNAPITVLGMATAGSILSFAFGVSEPSRKRLFGVAIASTFVGAAAVTVLPAAFKMEWVSPVVQAPLAFFLAFFARWIVPLLIVILPALVKRHLGLAPSNPPAGGQS
jgi:hypothetical protein